MILPENEIGTYISMLDIKGLLEINNMSDIESLVSYFDGEFHQWMISNNRYEVYKNNKNQNLDIFEEFIIHKYPTPNENNHPEDMMDDFMRSLLNNIRYDPKMDFKFNPEGLKIKTFREMVSMLIEDGYVEKISFQDKPHSFYSATLKGKFFIRNGGYRGLRTRDENQQTQVRRLQKIQTETQILIAILTVVLAASAVLPAIYSAIQIFQFVFSCYHQTGMK